MGLFNLLKKAYKDEELENLEDLVYDTSGSLDQDNSFSGLAANIENDEFIQEEDYDKELTVKIPKPLEPISLKSYSKEDIEKYIKSQCDVMEDASKNIEVAKDEYAVVTAYFKDIQIIENAPENIKSNIKMLAKTISDLTVDRRIFKAEENKLSSNVYGRMERIEEDMPNALIQLQNHESYFETVKKDMRMLEGEKMSLKYDARDLVRNQTNIEKISKILLVGLAVVFALFFAYSIVLEDDNNYLFMVVMVLSAILAVGLFALLKTTERKVLVTEIKLNKAINLLNKVKIKYINIASTLDYEYIKYGVKSSYELSRQYETYLVMREEKKKISSMTSELNDAEIQLELLLENLQLYDAHIWVAQVKALIDSKEMVEVRHNLSVRRQKLRNQIDYNNNRIEEAKSEIKRITISNTEYTQYVLNIIEHYEGRNRN